MSIPDTSPLNLLIGTTNLILARFSELSRDSLEKISLIFQASLKKALQAQHASNVIAMFSLGTLLVTSLAAFSTPHEKPGNVFTFLAAVAGITCIFAGMISLVYQFEISDYRYWENVCVIFMDYT